MLILCKYVIYFPSKDIIFCLTENNSLISQNNGDCFYVTYMIALKILQ